MKRPRRQWQPNDESWTPIQWLSWFLDNYSAEQLIPLGVWKAKKFILADLEGKDEEITAMRAAFALDGPNGTLVVLGAVLREMLPADAYVPELPESWNQRLRYYRQAYKDPALRHLEWGTWRTDRR